MSWLVPVDRHLGPIICHFCSEEGHIQPRCHYLYPNSRFPGFCRWCHFQGHIARHCPKLRSAYCDHCRGSGHTRRYCEKYKADMAVYRQRAEAEEAKERKRGLHVAGMHLCQVRHDHEQGAACVYPYACEADVDGKPCENSASFLLSNYSNICASCLDKLEQKREKPVRNMVMEALAS